MAEKQGYKVLTNREVRQNELMAMLSSTAGRTQVTQILRQCLNMPSGQLPLGTPIVPTILAHEFPGE